MGAMDRNYGFKKTSITACAPCETLAGGRYARVQTLSSRPKLDSRT